MDENSRVLIERYAREIARLETELAAARMQNAVVYGTSHPEIYKTAEDEIVELRAEIAIVRAAVIEECARAMNPMLRSMISRDEAARIIRSLAKGDSDE